MLIANYRGRSWQSRLIRFVTRSMWSHSAWLFDDMSAEAARALRQSGVDLSKMPYTDKGSVVEAWVPEVRNVTSLSDQHSAKTCVDIFSFREPLGRVQE